jgi:hypothetical protein
VTRPRNPILSIVLLYLLFTPSLIITWKSLHLKNLICFDYPKRSASTSQDLHLFLISFADF